MEFKTPKRKGNNNNNEGKMEEVNREEDQGVTQNVNRRAPKQAPVLHFHSTSIKNNNSSLG